MKKLTAMTLAALAVMCPLVVSATPVSGEVLFTGSFAGDARIFGAMTQFKSFSGVSVTGGNGLYQGLPSVPVTMQGFSFTSLTSPIQNVWDFSVGGLTYNFDLNSVQIVSRSRTTLVLQGTGVAEISGSESAAGTWTLTAYGNTKTFVAAFDPPTAPADGIAVPDSGARTVVLFGLAVVLLGLGRNLTFRKA